MAVQRACLKYYLKKMQKRRRVLKLQIISICTLTVLKKTFMVEKYS